MKARLEKLPGWALEDGKLHREYKSGGFFAVAFGFKSTCALVAQKQDHHPEWFIVFDRVVDMTTHDACGISALDFALATEMGKVAGPEARKIR